jgi:hypothetical protein
MKYVAVGTADGGIDAHCATSNVGPANFVACVNSFLGMYSIVGEEEGRCWKKYVGNR